MTQIIFMLGGVCFFLYGMYIFQEGLQHSSSDRVRNMLLKLTDRPLRAMGMGAITTFLLQSSSASTVMLVGFANVGLINVANGLAVSLGAGIGTSLFVCLLAWLLVIPLKSYAIILLIFGFFFIQIGKRRGLNFGKILMGFGFVLYGIKIAAESGASLKESQLVMDQIMRLADRPILGVILGTVLTIGLQSSTATIGILLSLALAGSITLESSIPLILGANIGTASTALFASMQANENGRRIAIGHMLAKIVGVVIFLPLLSWIAGVAPLVADTVEAQMAAVHLGYNFVISIILLPFVHLGAKFLIWLLPTDVIAERVFRAKYLDKTVLDTPTLAFGNVTREIVRMANIVQDMFEGILVALKQEDMALVDELEETDDQVDILCREIKFYLAGISQRELSERQAHHELNLLNTTSNLEEVGDIINRNLGRIARKKIRKQIRFSEEGWLEIKQFHESVRTNMQLAFSAFTTQSEEIAKKLERGKGRIHQTFEELQQAHLTRLHKGVAETLVTSSLHVDLLANLLRINVVVSSMVQPFLPTAAPSDQ